MPQVEWLRPSDATCLFVFAHGAGAGMHHPFMQAVAQRLAARHIATMRYHFPYMERNSRRPDPADVLTSAVHEAVQTARGVEPELPLFAGGKSMGGRMTSLAAVESSLPGVRGLIFLGFPLHPAGKPTGGRGAHLARVPLPMLFLQGTRDKLAEPELLRPLAESIGARASLQLVEGADHSFHLLKRSGRSETDALDEITDTIAGWCAEISASPDQFRIE